VLGKFFDGNKIFASTALAYRLYGKLNGAPLGYAVALLANIRGNRKKFLWYKDSSLFCLAAS